MSFNVSSPYQILKIKTVCQGELNSGSALSFHFPQLTKLSFAKTNSIEEEKKEVIDHRPTMAEHTGLYDPPFFPKIIKYTFLAVDSSANCRGNNCRKFPASARLKEDFRSEIAYILQ